MRVRKNVSIFGSHRTDSKLWLPSRTPLLLILSLCGLLGFHFQTRSFGQAPPPAPGKKDGELTEEAKERLKERDRFQEETWRLHKEGKLRQAMEVCQKMLDLEREVLGHLHEDVVGSLKQLSEMSEQLGSFDGAAEYRKDILKIQEKRFGQEHWRVTDARFDLEDLLTRAKLKPEERTQLKDASEFNSKVFRFWQEGKPRESLPLAEKALKIRGKLLGKEHPAYALSLNDLAVQHRGMGDYPRAEPLLKQALEIRKKALGEEHPHYAVTSLSGPW